MNRNGRWLQEACSLGAVMALTLTMWAAAAEGAATFHSGSGNCDGCHGKQVRGQGQLTAATSGAMLKGSDPSSTCLLCHEAPVAGLKEQHYIATPGAAMGPGVPPRQMTPGGDFGWLKKEYRWVSAEAGQQTSPGERHGHNIVAADFDYRSDTTHGRAPGGEYPSAALSCISCHDPHGTSGTTNQPKGKEGYRLLGGVGYQPKYDPTIPAFAEEAPAAVAPAQYNHPETDGNTRVAYGSGMSEWCRNCHGSIHGGGAFGHPAGNEAKLDATMVANYNAYVASGNLNGSSASSYTSLVPLEMGTDDYATLKETAVSAGSRGPDQGTGTPNVMCLTCHRAHASGWDSMTRWNTGALFIVQNGRYSGTDGYDTNDSAHGRTSAETARAYYDRRPDSFALYQRSLCNKCHVKD